MSKLTDEFKNTVVYVGTRDEWNKVQKAMFTMGFKWPVHAEGHKRVPVEFPYTSVYLFVDSDCHMAYGQRSRYPSLGILPKKYFDISNVTEAAEKHKAEKRAAKRASRKRKQLRKQGWTINTGVEPNRDDVVEVLFNNGSTSSGKVKWFYDLTDHHYAIQAYKLKPSTVTQQDMVDDIVKSAGGVEIDSPVVTQEEMIIELQTPLTINATEQVDVESYDTNPKRQYGVSSVPLNMWSPLASAYGALGLYNGSLKYGKANFANTKVEASIYIAAAMRHLSAWASGQEFDPADGVPNLGGVLANVAILLEARAAGTLIDDRLKMAGYLKEIDALKEIVKNLNVLHADKNPHHYVLGE